MLIQALVVSTRGLHGSRRTPFAQVAVVATMAALVIALLLDGTTTLAASRLVSADARVTGYWSDGSANVEIVASLRSGADGDGGSPVVVLVECLTRGVKIVGCDDSTTMMLPAPPQTTEARLTVRAPMGSDPLELRLHVGGELSTSLEVEVAERVLGVERHVWDCYSDARGHMDRCGGWGFEFDHPVRKWMPGKPIKTWLAGRSDYLEEAQRILAQIEELMNHTFVMVGAREEADFVAQIGVSDAVLAAACGGGQGCGFAHSGGPTVTSGEAHVADLGDAIPRWLITHEIMHALIPQGHFPSPYGWVGVIEGLSAIDEALLRFHADPAIQPGMTAQQVRDLIVFSDELLDASPLAPHTLVWRAREELLNAGSATFVTKGSCLADVEICRSNGVWDFAWSDHQIGEFELPGNHFQRLAVGRSVADASVAGKEFWAMSHRGEWYRVEWPTFSDSILWRPNYTSLMTILENILLLARADDLVTTERSNGRLVVRTREGRSVQLFYGQRMDISLVLDRATLQVSGYRVRVCEPGASGRCVLEVQARAGEYGEGRAIPEPIRQGTPAPNRWDGVLSASTLSAGLFHSCALRADATVACWGDDHYGQATPPEGERFVSITSGDVHGCGLRRDGSAVCWGGASSFFGVDDHYESRDGLWTEPTHPNSEVGYLAKPVGIMRFTEISSRGDFTCGIRVGGSPLCWGNIEDPPTDEAVVSISAGASYICALRENGAPLCWGVDRYGETRAPDDKRFVSLSSGASHTCALREDGSPVCWGLDDAGQSSPPPGERFTSVSSGFFHTCALRADGTPVCWGQNHSGEASPPTGERFVSISAGYQHTCAMRSDGSPICWGSDSQGQSSPPPGERFAVSKGRRKRPGSARSLQPAERTNTAA